jgi:hypothetical protein
LDKKGSFFRGGTIELTMGVIRKPPEIIPRGSWG